MDILLSTDNNYVMPTGVLMTSISMNNEDVHYHVLITDSLSQNNKQALQKIAEKYHHSLRFYVISESLLSMCPVGGKNQTAYITPAAYSRLFIAQILPLNIHRVIYLDGDMIVRKSLLPLWNTDIVGYALGVVHDMDERDHLMLRQLPYPDSYGYFNSGMLLINVEYWREHNCQERFYQFISNNKSLLECHDQDVLNCVLFKEKKWIPLTYNFQHGFIYDIKSEQRYLICLEDEIRKTEKDPAIIHYCAPLKPWHYSCLHPQRFVWNYYKRKSLWKKYRPDNNYTLREKLSFFVKKNNFWFFEHKLDSLHRNIYRRDILFK